MPVSNEFTIRFRAAGSTVIDQMVSRMVSEGVAYSLDLSEPDWRFLSENNASRTPATGTQYKPPGTVQINDRIGSWGGRTTSATSGAGYRAFEGGPDEGNVTLLQGAGGAFRCFWDEAGDQMWHVAGSTGSDDVKQGVIKYSAATDEFRHWTSGGTPDGLDSAASCWPGKGSAHNFGTSAWDPQRRRLYKMMRLPSQGATFWPCWVDVSREQEYATRAEWIAGRDSWFLKTTEDNGQNFALWPQTVYVPELGTTGSVIILQKDSNTLTRWDCSTRVWSQYTITFNAGNTPISGNSAVSTLGRRGVSMVYHAGFIYVASFNGTDAKSGLWDFWRIYIPPDGSTPVITTTLAKCPVGMDLSGYGWPGTHTELCVLNGKIYAFHTDLWGTDGEREYTGGVYAYDIGANAWSAVATSWAQRLIALGRLNALTGSSPHNFTVTEIPRLNAFLMATAVDSFEFAAWLFKPL